jgi:hypothetical protein
MSKYLVVAALLAVAACGEKQAETPPADTAAAAAPAPAPAADSAAMPDSAMASDTTRSN